MFIFLDLSFRASADVLTAHEPPLSRTYPKLDRMSLVKHQTLNTCCYRVPLKLNFSVDSNDETNSTAFINFYRYFAYNVYIHFLNLIDR